MAHGSVSLFLRADFATFSGPNGNNSVIENAVLRKGHPVLWGAEPETLSAKVLKFESERNNQRF